MITKKIIDYESPSVEVDLFETCRVLCESASGTIEDYNTEDEFKW